MSKLNSQFTGSIPEIYDTCLGPLFFEFSAKDLADRIKRLTPTNGKILEIACGTGISTYFIRKAVPETSKITATDLNDAMLEVARKKLDRFSSVSIQQADALSLPFNNQGFDVVACQFGIMFFPDKTKALEEFFRVLKPGGHLVFNVWDSLDQNPCVKIAGETISSFFYNDGPQFLKTPFGFHDTHHIENLLAQAGFNNIEVKIVLETVEVNSADDIARGFVEGNPGIIEINERATAKSDEIIKAVSTTIKNTYGTPPLKIPLQELVFTAKKPEKA